MKNIFKISALCLTLAIGSTSCKNEVSDIFDHSAAERLDATKSDYANYLCKDGGKWAMSYFANATEAGYTYVCTFAENGTVKMSGKNIFISEKYGKGTNTPLFKSEFSLWEIITDNGPVLTFNSYNPVFHLFSDPYDITGTHNPETPDTDINETGYGHEGDYEFMLMEKVDENTLRLKGKKTGITIMMSRLAADTDDEVYMNGISKMTALICSSKTPYGYLDLGDGERYCTTFISTDAETTIATQQMSFYPENGDAVTQTRIRNFIVTDEGIRFMTQYHGEDSTFTVQNFVRQDDGSLLCTDDNKAKLYGLDFSDLFMGKTLVWRLDKTTMTGELPALYARLVAGFRSVYKKTFNYFEFKYDSNAGVDEKGSYVLSLKASSYAGSCYIDVTKTSASTVQMTFRGEGDDNGKMFLENVDGLNEFVNAFANTTLTITSDNRMVATTQTLTSGNNSVVVNAQ